MIDPVIGWFYMVAITDKTASNVANVIELTWFTSYPPPKNII